MSNFAKFVIGIHASQRIDELNTERIVSTKAVEGTSDGRWQWTPYCCLKFGDFVPEVGKVSITMKFCQLG